MKAIKNYKKGFTLIELLVAVLIIGILAAIALPQYRKAVAKAELTQIVSATKTLKQAQDRFFLLNNAYANNINQLDISVESPDIICRAGATYVACQNKNFVLWRGTQSRYLECAAKTIDQNSALSNACKSFIKENSKTSSSALCSTCSSCNFLNQKPCYKWSSNNSYF